MVATIYFGMDVQKTGTLREFLNWIGLRNFDQIQQYIPEYSSAALSIPAKVMMALSARLVVIEIINIFLLIMVTFIWFEILWEFVDAKPSRYPMEYEREQSRVNAAFESDHEQLPRNGKPNHQIEEITSTTSSQSTQLENGLSNKFNRSISAYTNPNFDQEIDEAVERRFKNYQAITPEERSTASRAQSVERQISQRKTPPKEPRPDYQVDASPVKIPPPDYPESEPESLQAGRKPVVRTGSHVQTLRQTFEQTAVPERPPNLMDRERSKSPTGEKEVSRNSSFVSGRPELRNQLPWSYFQKGEETSKKFFVHPITGERMSRPVMPEQEPLPESANENDEGKSHF